MATTIEDVAERALDNAGRRAAALAADMFGPDAAEAVTDTTHQAVRQLRRGARRASDVSDDAARCIGRQPLTAVVASFIGGVFAGAVAAAMVLALRRT